MTKWELINDMAGWHVDIGVNLVVDRGKNDRLMYEPIIEVCNDVVEVYK